MNFKKKLVGGAGPPGWDERGYIKDPCDKDYDLITQLDKCRTYDDVESWKTTVSDYFDDLKIKFTEITPEKINICKPMKYLNMLNNYEMGIRAKVVNEPNKNVEAYNNFTQDQLTSLDQIKQDFTNMKQALEASITNVNAEIQTLVQDKETKTNTIKQHNSEIAMLQQRITKQTSFVCYKKGDTWKDGWDKKTLQIIGEGTQRKILWTGRKYIRKELVLDAITEIKITEMHVVIYSKNDKGKSIVTLHLKVDPEHPNDLFYLYAHVSGAVTALSRADTAPSRGGKKLSHYKKTKNRKFNSLSNKSKTKKRKLIGKRNNKK